MGFLIGMWIKMPSWAKKGLIYIGIALALLYALRLYSNRIYSQGKEAGRMEMSEEMVKAKQKEWAEKEKAIFVEREQQQKEIAAKRAEINSRLVELDKQRNDTRAALGKFVSTLNSERDRQNATVYSIPVDQLDGAIRDLSNKLAASQ